MAKKAINEDSFSEFWMFLDVEDDNSKILEIRTYADFVSQSNNTLITKRLIYTVHVAIYEQEAYIEPEIKIAMLT